MVIVLMLAAAFFAVIAAGIQQYVKSEKHKRELEASKVELETLRLKEALKNGEAPY